MNVVSNASPLINLAWIGELERLHTLYGELLIPEAVWHEVVVEGVGLPGADKVKAASWIKTRSATNRPLVHTLRQDPDAGEAETIALALEIEADLLLMDERLWAGDRPAFGVALYRLDWCADRGQAQRTDSRRQALPGRVT